MTGELANQRMVDRMIVEGALWSPRLIEAFRQTPRHRFLHHVFALHQRGDGWREIDTSEPSDEELELLYSDRALITRLAKDSEGNDVAVSSSSQPTLMAEMLEDLRLEPGQRVLEIGAGTGYNAALMAQVAGPGRVHSVDVDRVVLAEAAEHFRGFAERRVLLHHGDGRSGWAEAAPFDRVMVTAATPDLEPAWLEQMSDGGTLVAPVVFAPGMAFVIRGEVRHGVFQGRLMRGAYFMALRAEEEAPQDKTESPSANGQLKTRPAPWAGWFERQRPRLGWGGFAQALTFYGWLRGLDVLHGGGHSAYANFGLASGVDVCWFGSEDWQVSGSAGQDIGETLWRAWLAAGGPWPTEFVLSASEAEMAGNGAEVYRRRGARCWQVWELMRLRERAGWR